MKPAANCRSRSCAAAMSGSVGRSGCPGCCQRQAVPRGVVRQAVPGGEEPGHSEARGAPLRRQAGALRGPHWSCLARWSIRHGAGRRRATVRWGRPSALYCGA
eukprot:11269287-Heterocapsa_arctica.AAC.1